ncbi:amidohydrolase family protein [Rubneribacter sp.]|nr:amidohydrolase [Candidatus Rubneribacter avistercoris]
MKTINCHTHFVLPAYYDAVVKHGADKEDGFPMPTRWTIEENVEFMDEVGVDVSVLSLSTPHPHWGDDAESRELCRKINETIAQEIAKFPDRFRFMGALPLPDMEGSIAEARHALDDLGAVGVKVPSNAQGVYLGNESLEPLWAELNERKAVVFIHPSRPPRLTEGVFTSGPMPVFEYLVDETRTVVDLLCAGVLDRHPNVRFILPHVGAFMPTVVDRLARISKHLVETGFMKEEADIYGGMSKIYVDISGDVLPRNFDNLMTLVKPDKVLFGLDYPHTKRATLVKNAPVVKAFLHEKYPDAADMILGGNAQRLFDLA